jgi:hypothetical protein
MQLLAAAQHTRPCHACCPPSPSRPVLCDAVPRRLERCATAALTRWPPARPAPTLTRPWWLLHVFCSIYCSTYRCTARCTALQEITNSYQPGVIHRPDMSLYVYGAPTGGVAAAAGALVLARGSCNKCALHCKSAVQAVQSAGSAIAACLLCQACRSHAAAPTAHCLRPRPPPPLWPAGFVTPVERPLLSAIDLPNYNPADPFGQTALTDAIYNSEWRQRCCRGWGAGGVMGRSLTVSGILWNPMLRWQPVSCRPGALTPCLPCLPPAKKKGSTFAEKNP